MTLVLKALELLDLGAWGLVGEPTNEEEFKQNFQVYAGNKNSVTWSQIQTALADGNIVAMAEVRRQRDKLLAETDWMASSDYSISDAWKTYRAALRDLPANNTSASWDGTTLGNVTFPTKPS